MDKKEEKSGKSSDKKELSELEKCQKERDEYLAGWQRAKADFSNYRKDETARFSEFARLSNEGLISELTTVLDSFELGLTVVEDSSPAYKGMLLIRNQLEDLLRKYGLEKISVKPGQDFDPGREEAVGEIESKEKPGTVAEEAERGYILNGKVIKPARVKLSKQHG